MYCNRFKRSCQCAPKPQLCGLKRARTIYSFFPSITFFLQHNCINKDPYGNRAKRQQEIGLLALFFWGNFFQNIVEESL